MRNQDHDSYFGICRALHGENNLMQSVSQPKSSVQSQIIKYALRALLALFGIVAMLSYAYVLFVSLTAEGLQAVELIVPVIVITASLVLGWFIDRKHPGHTIALLFLVMAYSLTVGTTAVGIKYFNETHPTQFSPSIDTVTMVLGNIMWQPAVYFPLILMPLYFPTGKLLSPRWRVVVVGTLGIQLWTVLAVIFRPWPWLEYDITNTRALNGIPGSEAFFDSVAKNLNHTRGIFAVPGSNGGGASLQALAGRGTHSDEMAYCCNYYRHLSQRYRLGSAGAGSAR